MDKSFYIVPEKHKSKYSSTNLSMQILGTGNVPFSMTLSRIEMIEAICHGAERSHQTNYSHIVKLCRLCISDICKKLTEKINWETERYKRYSTVHEQVKSNTYQYPVKNRDGLIEDLEINITDARFLYNQYLTLYQDLKKKKLYTKACVICDETKPTD